MLKYWLALCFATILLWSAGTEAKRVALVVGNANYEKTGSLANPVNDVLTIAQSAKKAGFDDVIVARDLRMQDFQVKLREFRQRATGADLAMVYYAGHGVESRGKNWLIPIDAKLQSSLDLPYEAINLDRILEALEGSSIGMVVLDACRNNPFGDSWQSGTRAVKQGLVGVDADDILIIYAAAPGQTISDGNGANSAFATSLAKRLVQPDLPIQMLGGSIRDDVLSATGGKQRPYVSANITGTPVYLVQSATRPTTTAVGSTTNTGNRARLDALSWRGALSANSSSAYSAYLTEFPDGLFADLAKEKINALRQPIVGGRTTRASTGQRSNPAPSPTATPKSTVTTPPISAFYQTGEQKPEPASKPPSSPAPIETAPKNLHAASNQSEIKMARSGADLAYVPPETKEPPLPSLPPTPVLLQKDYPDCKESYLHLADPLDKANEINACTVKLDQYYANVLNKFREDMNAHQDRISTIYTDQVAGRMEYSAANRDRFYKAMMQEHADSNPDGPNLAVYRSAVQLYESDRNYLRDRFCFNTGCAGYTIPEDFGMTHVRKEQEKKKSEKQAKKLAKKSKKKSGGKCKKSKGRGRLLGAVFGGLAGKAAGLNTAQSLLASGLGALIVGEIACQLDDKEKEQAAEATQTVAKVEKVGATAKWKSPTRSGVSGSSTVTALNTQPNGRKCLTITDVAFVNGEETRVSKQMCRSEQGGRYVIMA